MKLNHLFTTVLAAAMLAVPAFAEEETPLGKEMEKVSKALKLVNRNLSDPAQKDANLAKIADAKAALEKAATLEPAKAKDVPAGEKAKFVADYKAGVEQTLKSLEELKSAIAAGKTEDASKAMEKLNGEKKEAHKKFKKED
jgi:soluble cytochrome b562